MEHMTCAEMNRGKAIPEPKELAAWAYEILLRLKGEPMDTNWFWATERHDEFAELHLAGLIGLAGFAGDEDWGYKHQQTKWVLTTAGKQRLEEDYRWA